MISASGRASETAMWRHFCLKTKSICVHFNVRKSALTVLLYMKELQVCTYYSIDNVPKQYAVLLYTYNLYIAENEVGLDSRHEFILGNTIQYNDNIKYCGLCSTSTSRIEKAKYNTHHQRNIMMTDDLHVPVTSAALLYKCCAWT